MEERLSPDDLAYHRTVNAGFAAATADYEAARARLEEAHRAFEGAHRKAGTWFQLLMDKYGFGEHDTIAEDGAIERAAPADDAAREEG